MLAHIPGLQVVYPVTPYDAKGMLNTALAGTDPDTLLARGQRLRIAGDMRASLPYFRTLANGPGAELAWVHFEYGRTLYYSSFAVESAGPLRLPGCRTSVERVAVTRAAIGEFQRAIELAADDRARARYMHLLARALQAWGFYWEAWIWQRRAAATDPGEPLYGHEADGLYGAMRDPVHAQVLPNDEALRAAH